MIGEFIYMLPSDMNLRIGRVQGCNNKILVSRTGFKIGTNLKINLDGEKDKPNVKSKEVEMVKTEPDVKPKVKTKPNIEPNEKHKQDVKPNIKFNRESEHDTNKVTYEEEKVALVLGITSISLWYGGCLSNYLLLVFVMKYVQIKTPTPVISAHKF